MSQRGRDKELRWTLLHPVHWSKNEVQGWLQYVLEKNSVPGGDRHKILEAFDDVNGNELINMDLSQFKDLSSSYGQLLHETFRALLPSQGGHPPSSS